MSAFASLIQRMNPSRGNPRNPQDDQTPAARHDAREVEIAVLESVGGGQAVGRIVAGTLGTLDNQGRFVVDPAYVPISPLMLYVFGQPIPVDGEATRVSRHTVKAGDVDAIRANLMRASAANWSKLYESVTSFAGINPAVVESDKQLSLSKVDDHVRALGLADHDVHVVVKRQVYVDELGQITPEMQDGDVLSIVSDPTKPTVVAQVVAHSAQIHEADGEEPSQASAEVVTGLAMGSYEALIAGAMSVAASDVEQADRIKAVIIDSMLRNNSTLCAGLTLRNPQIQNVTSIATDSDDDSADEMPYER